MTEGVIKSERTREPNILKKSTAMLLQNGSLTTPGIRKRDSCEAFANSLILIRLREPRYHQPGTLSSFPADRF